MNEMKPFTDALFLQGKLTTLLGLEPDCSAAAVEAAVKAVLQHRAEAVRLLKRYRLETPLGHQPHMIAHEADAALAVEGAR